MFSRTNQRATRGGAQIIFLETFMDFAEMEIALRAKKESGDALEICSFACAPEGRLLCGMSLVEAFARLSALGARMVGANCMNGPGAMVQLLKRFPVEHILAAYPTAGEPQVSCRTPCLSCDLRSFRAGRT